jgi:hypothetical protein
MADVTGARGTGNVSQSTRKVDMKAQILLLEPSAAPLTVLSARLNTDGAVNPEFSWQEDRSEPRFDAINNGAGYASGATSVVVDNGAYFAAQDLVKVSRTGEVFRVVAITPPNTLSTIVRGVGSGAAAIVDNDELIIIGSAQPEGDTSKPARSSNPTKVTNYTQIHRTPWESTETLRSSDTFTRPPDWNHQANKAGIEHKKSWEYIFFHGRPSEDLTGSQPRRTTGGVFYFITTNRTDAAGQLTESEFFGGLSPMFRYGSETKVAFASRLAVDVLNTFPRGKLELVQSDNDTTYGLRVMRYVSPHGTLNVITHNLLEGQVFGGYIVILDMDQVARRPLSGGVGSRDTHIRENIQAPDADTRKDEYLTEVGLEFGQEKTHGIFSGITS